MINKLRTKPRDKAVYKDMVRSIPAFIVCLALSVYSLIAYFSFADFPLYSVIAFPVITAVVVLFAVLGIVRGRKKAFRFSTAGKDDRYPTVMIMQAMPADKKTPFPTAYLEYYPCGAEPVKQYAELEAALNDLIDQVSDSEAEKLYEQEEQLSDALGDCIDIRTLRPSTYFRCTARKSCWINAFTTLSSPISTGILCGSIKMRSFSLKKHKTNNISEVLT